MTQANQFSVSLLLVLVLSGASVLASVPPNDVDEDYQYGKPSAFFTGTSEKLEKFDRVLTSLRKHSRQDKEPTGKLIDDAELQIKDIRGDLSRLQATSYEASTRLIPRIEREMDELRATMEAIE